MPTIASRFSETPTGLDHAGFAVPTRQDLEQWQAHLESNGVVRAERADQTADPVANR